MSHYKNVCQFGFVHAQCRCPDPSKMAHPILCPFPQGHDAIKKGDSKHPLVIGLTGFAGSGKDTVGEELIRRGWKRVSFAEPLKQLALAVDPIITIPYPGEFLRLSEIVRTHGWERAKWDFLEVRRILQQLGNQAREIIRDDVWVSIAEKHIKKWLEEGFNVVLTDTRYPNEATMIRSLDNGFVVRVNRPGVGPFNDHISDRGLDESLIDTTLNNDETLDEISSKVYKLFIDLT